MTGISRAVEDGAGSALGLRRRDRSAGPHADERVRRRARAVLDRIVRRAGDGAGAPVEIEAHHVRGEPISYAEAERKRYREFRVGQRWGPPWDTTWFRLRSTVPEEWAGEEVVLRFENHARGGGLATAEALLWRDGMPIQGLSWTRPDALLFRPAEGGEQVDLFLEAAANPPLPLTFTPDHAWPLMAPDFDGEPQFRLVRCELVVWRRDVFELGCDLRTVLELAAELPSGSQRAAELHDALAAACDALDPDDLLATAPAAEAALAGALAVPAPLDAHRIAAVGHAHIDTAWLWPMRETVRKCARTYSSALALMNEYPDYRFVSSSPQHLAWIQEAYPQLFAGIVERVRSGQFEPVGAMWVEADCNIPSGESLVRQIVHGLRWFADQLGVHNTEMWLPDSFGYSGNLPQIMASAGIRWFVTQKLSWNDTNRFPHQTFCWEGIDGTRVKAHFLAADTYGGDMSMGELFRGANKGEGTSLYPFGWGDGGGGPTRDMLEAARRASDLGGAPRVTLDRADAFLAAREAGPEPLPVWVGELYLEKHRGVYTSQAGIKRRNRHNEVLLQAAELWSTVRPDRHPYPSSALDRAWKLLLTNQFHDVLPGSSIHRVYEEAEAEHAQIEAIAQSLVDEAHQAIAAAVDTRDAAEPLVVFNGAPFPRREIVDAGSRTLMVDVPPLGYAVVDAAGPADARGVTPIQAGEGWFANQYLHVRWDGRGGLVSIWDRQHQREVLAPGRRGNVFHLHHDRPDEWDAWDIDRRYLDDFVELDGEVEISVLEAGPLRARVRFRRRFGASSLDQTMTMTAGSRRIDFLTEVDWHEDHKLLKVAFPVAVHTDHANYEIQFGHLSRPTHENTSWERARFEVCAQRWADLSEAEYGVALLNDCKYGYDVRDNVLRLTLLRAPTAPDPHCDRGRHRFTYALLPHPRDLGTGGVIAAGYALNAPLAVVSAARHPGPLPGRFSFVACDDPAVAVETVKRADDGDGVVLRGYEGFGGHRRARLRIGVPVARATLCDLLEHDEEELQVDDGHVVLPLRPFQLLTIRLRSA
jgi:alpha-mannosidase